MHVICCQLDIAWEDKTLNFNKVERLLKAARPARDSLIVLPEMFSTGFTMNTASMAERTGGPTERFVRRLAREHRSAVIAGLPAIGRDGKPRNMALVADPKGKVLARYEKLNPFSMGNEDQHYRAGKHVVVVNLLGAAIAPTVCYDLRFPEVYRLAARRGAEVLVCVANWPIKRVQHWVTLLEARAIENQAWVIGVNRCGQDPQFTYPGRTLIVDPHGVVVADASDREGAIEYEMDIDVARRWRAEFPALRDMKPAS